MSTKQKITVLGTEARTKLARGAEFLAKAVSSTLGPNGANFVHEKGRKVTNDGVTVAREIELKDEFENLGLSILREAAIKTVEEVGDGTSTAITLAYAIMKEGLKQMPNERSITGKMTPAALIRKIEAERSEVEKTLIAMAKPIETEAELIDSAVVSVEDRDLGQLIGQAQWKIGRHGVVIAEDTAEQGCSIEYVNGIKLDNGFSSSLAINDQVNEALDVKDLPILLTNHVLESLEPISQVLTQIYKTGARDVVLMCRAFTERAIKDCMENVKTGFRIYPVNCPYVNQNEVMKDLQAVLGGRYINKEETELDAIQLSDFGYCERLVAKRQSATVAGKKDDKSPERIEKRVEELKKAHSGEVSSFEKRTIEARIAQLSFGFAIVKIGAPTEAKRKYLKDKADDAVNAVRAAFQEGVVPGAGLAFKHISEALPESYMLKRPLMSIYEQIIFSGGDEFKIEDWVKDPVKVLRIALEKACGVAGVLATAAGASATKRDEPCIHNAPAPVNPEE